MTQAKHFTRLVHDVVDDAVNDVVWRDTFLDVKYMYHDIRTITRVSTDVVIWDAINRELCLENDE